MRSNRVDQCWRLNYRLRAAVAAPLPMRRVAGDDGRRRHRCDTQVTDAAVYHRRSGAPFLTFTLSTHPSPFISQLFILAPHPLNSITIVIISSALLSCCDW